MNIKKIPLIIVSLCLAVHLWFSNSELLTATSPTHSVMWGIIALSYSIIGAWSVLSTKELKPIIAFAIMDGMAVFLKINPPDNYNLVIGLFYAVYTAYIILITWRMSKEPSEKEEPQQSESSQPQQAQQALPMGYDYNTAMSKCKGMLNGKATEAEKKEKIKNLILNQMSQGEDQSKMIEKSEILWGITY